MSPILVLGLVVMVLAMGALVQWTDRTPVRQLTDQSGAQARFLADYPDVQVQSVQHSTDGKVALLFLGESRPIGMVAIMGDHEVTRMLSGDLIRSVTELPEGIRLRTRDFSMPWLNIALAPPDRQAWSVRLQALVEDGHHGNA